MLEHSLIGPDQTWPLLAILLGAAAFGLWAERTRWGARLSAAVIAIGTTFVLSNLSVIPASAPVYDMVWGILVPLAIPLLLFRANLGRIVREAGPTLAAFVLGAIGTVMGTVLAIRLVPLGEEGWKLAAVFCATYVGGSLNYVAAAETVGLRSGDLLSAGVAADNLVMTLYFLLLFALPSMKRLRRWYPVRHREEPSTLETETEIETKTESEPESAPATTDRQSAPPSGSEPHLGAAPEDKLTVLSLTSGLAVSAALCAAGYGIAAAFGVKASGILVITVLVVALATARPSWLGRIGGADQVGTFLMQVFFATIGASANIAVVLRVGPLLFVFAAIILLVHLIFLLGAGKLLRLDLAEIVIASNANMGGPTTAAAMATARRWRALVIPAILCGTLGYASGTFVGVAVGHLLR